MSFAVAMPPSAYCVIADDSSLSQEGALLREVLAAAIAPPEIDRGDEIYKRVAAALRKASEDGVLIVPETFNRALELLASLPYDLPLPEIVVESENEIGMDWDEGAKRVLSLTVRDTAAVGYAGLLGDEPLHGRVVFSEGFPETLRFFFRKLYPRIGRAA